MREFVRDLGHRVIVSRHLAVGRPFLPLVGADVHGLDVHPLEPPCTPIVLGAACALPGTGHLSAPGPRAWRPRFLIVDAEVGVPDEEIESIPQRADHGCRHIRGPGQAGVVERLIHDRERSVVFGHAGQIDFRTVQIGVGDDARRHLIYGSGRRPGAGGLGINRDLLRPSERFRERPHQSDRVSLHLHARRYTRPGSGIAGRAAAPAAALSGSRKRGHPLFY